MSDALIYTKRGNLPVDSLKHSVRWVRADSSVVLEEQFHDEHGELVRNNVHALHVDVLRDLIDDVPGSDVARLRRRIRELSQMLAEAHEDDDGDEQEPSRDVTVGLSGAGMGGEQVRMG
jgi:hypothetical protein